MAKKLDKARDYAVIVGDTEGRVYEQDNLYFGPDGNEWTDPNAPARSRGGSAKRAAPAEALSPVDDQVAQQLAAQAEQAGG